MKVEAAVQPGARLDRETVRVQVGKRECPSPHGSWNKLGRVAWGIVRVLLFRPSPRLCYGWRRWLLRLFGAQIGRRARIHPAVRIWAPWNLRIGSEASVAHHVDLYSVDTITIGDHATVSQYAHLCTASHDISDPHMSLVTAPIVIADQAWVCAGAFVAPGTTVAQGAVIGAHAVVTRDVPAWSVVAGNPAVKISDRRLRANLAPVVGEGEFST